MAFQSSANSNRFGALSNNQNTSSPFAQMSSGGTSPVQIVVGDELEDTETEKIGLVALAGETLVKLFPDTYDEDKLPIPSSSLLTIAQRRGILAAAGPSGLVISSTISLRQSFKAESKGAATVDFQSQLTLPMSLQISHIAFTADEKYLLVGAAVGGIAAYSVDDLLSSGTNTKASFEISTGPIREMKPIPTTDKPELVCILTGGEWGQAGDVGMVNLNTRNVQAGLKSGVTTISWSPKGKQIVCGGIGGGLCWITPEGQSKGEVDSMPGVSKCFVSSLLWIETHIFYVAYTPIPPSEMDSETTHCVLTRTPQGQHTFNKIIDTAPPFGMSSRPTVYSFIHMKGWSSLKDLLLLTNTSSSDIGLVLRWDNTNFQSSPIAQDARRGTLPMTESMMDTTPIGLALDLSVGPDEKVKNPLIGVDLDESTTSFPAVYVLNNEGKVSAYWVVFTDAVLAKNESAAYPGLLAYGNEPPSTPAKPTQPQAATTTPFGAPNTFSTTPAATPAFGQSSFGQSSALGGSFGAKPPAFGSSSGAFGSSTTPQSAFGGGAPAFGSTTALGTSNTAFGSTSTLGSNTAFGSTSALGKPAFGSTAFGSSTTGGTFGSSTTTSAFGSTSALGSGTSAFGQTTVTSAPSTAFGSTSSLGNTAFGTTSALGARAAPAFGQSAFGSSGGAFGSGSAFSQPSAFGNQESAFGSSTATGSGGFGRFASSGGFLAAAASAPQQSPFGSGGALQTSKQEPDAFGGLKKTSTPFGAPETKNAFQITSAFQSTASPTKETPPSNVFGGSASGGGMFGGLGSSLGGALGTPAQAAIKEEEMGDESEEEEDFKPRSGVTGGNMFSIGDVKPDTSKGVFGSTEQKSSFGTGIFGSALNQTSAQNTGSSEGTAFGLTSKTVFGTPASTETKNVFGSTKPAEDKLSAFGSGAFGKGLFGSAMLKDDSKSPFGSPQKTTEKPAEKPVEKPAEKPAPKEPEPAITQALPDDSEDETEEAGSPGWDDAPPPPDFTAEKSAKTGWGADKMALPPGIGKEETPRPKQEPPSATSTTPRAPPNLSSINVTSTPPSAGPRKSASGSGMSRPTARDKTKPKGKASPEAKAKSSTTTIPEGFSIFGSGGFAGVKKEAPLGGGSIFSSVPSSGATKQNLFADLAKKVENYQPEDTSEDEDEDDEEDEDGEFEGEEEEGEFEDEEEEDGEWIEGDDGDESPVEVKYQQETSAKPPPQTSSLFGNLSQHANTTPESAPAPPPVDPAKQRAELEAARRAAQEQQEKRRREAEEAEIQRKKDEELKRREELKQQLLNMMKNELRVAQQEQQYYQSLQTPSQPDKELVEFMEYVEGGPYTALPGLNGIMEQLFISINRGINTYAANLRNLEAYVTYNKTYEKKTKQDVLNVDQWRMSNINDLGEIFVENLESVKSFMVDYEKNGVKEDAVDMVGKIDGLMIRHREIPSILAIRSHPRMIEEYKRRPLNPQQRVQRASLRRKIPQLRQTLSTAENDFTIFQAKVAAMNKKFKSNWGGVKPPTHEAVRSTIIKLTKTAKEKGERIDMLEDGLRKIRIRSASPSVANSRGGTPASFSRQGSVVNRGSSLGPAGTTSTAAPGAGVGGMTPIPTPDSFEYYDNLSSGGAGGGGTSPSKTSSHTQPHSKLGQKNISTPIKEEPESDDDDDGEKVRAALHRIPLVASYTPTSQRRNVGGAASHRGDRAGSSLPTTPAGRKVAEMEERDLSEVLGMGMGAGSNGGGGVITGRKWRSLEEYRDEKGYRKQAGRRMMSVLKSVGVREIS